MKHKDITKFNYIVGNAPEETLEGVLRQIAQQCTYLIEEVLETKEAAYNGDIVECLDGVNDVRYVAGYLETLLESLGVKVGKGFAEVCNNNMLKTTTSRELAEKWVKEKQESGIDVYISEVEYEGEMYYTVRRTSDNKVTKFTDFPSVDLKPFIPKHLLTKE